MIGIIGIKKEHNHKFTKIFIKYQHIKQCSICKIIIFKDKHAMINKFAWRYDRNETFKIKKTEELSCNYRIIKGIIE